MRCLRDGFGWNGRAADAFRHQLDHLPRDLDRAGDAHRLAGSALATYSWELRSHQTQARALEALAAERVRRVADAPDEVMADVVSAAERLRARVLDDARRCTLHLEDARRHAPEPPGWLRRTADQLVSTVKDANAAVSRFVQDHAAVISAIVDASATISSALGVVAMLASPIPVLGQAVASVAGTAALVTAGVALLGHTALAAYAGGSWKTVVTDAVGIATAGAGRGVEVVGGRIATARGLTVSPAPFEGVRGAVGVLRHPGAAWTASAYTTMTMPDLVIRSVSYQFELAGGGLSVYELASSGSR